MAGHAARERAGLLRQVAATIRAHAGELAELEAREVGKPRRDALRSDVSYSSAGFDYYAGLAETLHGEIIDQGPIEARVIYEPYGVVAAILPFNWPPIHFTKKCAPALAAGNTVIVKPGEQAPLTVLRLPQLANEVLPPGVLNAVPGPAAGPALVSHPQVERITFTGATATGRRVLASAAQNLTYATMELGGKNAILVLADADLDAAVAVAIEGMFYNQGEACTSTSRIVVHDSVHDEFLSRFARATEALVVGDGLDPATDVGPMVDAAQRDKVLAYLRAGLDEGARLVTQGRLPADKRLRDGYWVAPSVLADVTPEMTIALVYATGFDAMTGSLFGMGITGRDGLRLEDKWADGPRTYLGLTTRGFPNLFMITGPQSPSVLSNMPVAIEQNVEWIAGLIQDMREHDLDVAEPARDAEDQWVGHHNEVAAATLLLGTDSWWVGANIPGKPRTLYPYVGGVGPFRTICHEVAQDGYRGLVRSRHGAPAPAQR